MAADMPQRVSVEQAIATLESISVSAVHLRAVFGTWASDRESGGSLGALMITLDSEARLARRELERLIGVESPRRLRLVVGGQG